MAPTILKSVLILCLLGLIVTGTPPASSAEEVRVGDIQVISEKNGSERVCFLLNPFCNPKIFSIEGDKPRIVVDIPHVRAWTGKPTVAANGVSIRQVRTHLHRDDKRLRIVLDLTPSLDYTAEPLYFEAEGIYCIAVSAK
ncbi:MAG: AMIN domain-containing protein [Candidatus Desulfacyla sp.]